MKILSLDSSALCATVAICENNRTLALYTQKNGLTHSETLLPMVNSVLKNTKLSVDDIDMFAVCAGPGSFTGVRIGVSVIKGLAFGKNKICVPVSTIEALAENANGMPGKFLAVPVMDARRSQLYNAVFMYENGKRTRLCEDRLISAEDLKKELLSYDMPVYFFGDGYTIASKLDIPKKMTTSSLLIDQNAVSVASVALSKYEAENNKTIFTDTLLRPEYLRLSQAEREANEKEKGTKI